MDCLAASRNSVANISVKSNRKNVLIVQQETLAGNPEIPREREASKIENSLIKARIYEENGEFEEATKIYIPLSKEAPEAMFSLAQLLYKGQGILKDFSQANFYMQQAASLGNADAINFITQNTHFEFEKAEKMMMLSVTSSRQYSLTNGTVNGTRSNNVTPLNISSPKVNNSTPEKKNNPNRGVASSHQDENDPSVGAAKNGPMEKKENSEKLKQTKIKELNVLYEMYLSILSFKSGKDSKKEVILKISQLSGGAEGLSFNDRNDDATYAIRNRYTHIKKSKKKYGLYIAKNENEIELNLKKVKNDVIAIIIDGNCKKFFCIHDGQSTLIKGNKFLEQNVIFTEEESQFIADNISSFHKVDENKIPEKTVKNIINRVCCELGLGKFNNDKPGRINFEDLSKIQIIFDKKGILPENIEIYLDVLEAKLLYILQKELKEEKILPKAKVNAILSLQASEGNSYDLEEISSFVSLHYHSDVALKDIKGAVETLKNFEISNEFSIHHFAGKMIFIGELCHDIKHRFNDYSGIDNQFNDRNELIEIFGTLNKIRSCFLHDDLHITLNDFSNKEKISRINSLLKPFFENFSKLLDSNIKGIKENQSDFNKCLLDIKEIKRLLDDKGSELILERKLEQGILEAKKIIGILNSVQYKHFIAYCKATESIRKTINSSKKIIRGANNINIENIEICEKQGDIGVLFDILEAANLPDRLERKKINEYLSSLKELIKSEDLSNIHKEYLLLLKDKGTKEFLRNLLGEKFNNFNPDLDLKQSKILLNKLKDKKLDVEKVLNTFFNKVIAVHSLPAKNYSFANAKKSYKNLTDIIPINAQNSLARYNFILSLAEQDKIAQLTLGRTDFKNKNYKSILLVLKQQKKFLVKVINENSLTKNYKEYILNFSVALIEKYTSELDKIKPLDFIPSWIFKEFVRTAKIARDCYIAHGVLSRKEIPLIEDILNDILSDQSINALEVIDNLEPIVIKTFQVHIQLGYAYLTLHLYEEAAKYFEQALDCIAEPDNQKRLFEITPNDTIIIDMPKVLYGIDGYELSMTNALLHTYILGRNPEKAIFLAEKTLAKLKDIFKSSNIQNKLSSLLPQGEDKFIKFSIELILKYRGHKKHEESDKDFQFFQEYLKIVEINAPKVLSVCNEAIELTQNPAAILYAGDSQDLAYHIFMIKNHAASAHMNKGEYKKAENYYKEFYQYEEGINKELVILKIRVCQECMGKSAGKSAMFATKASSVNNTLFNLIKQITKLRLREIKNENDVDKDISFSDFLNKNKRELKENCGHDLATLYLAADYQSLSELKDVNIDYKEFKKLVIKIEKNIEKYNSPITFALCGALYLNMCSKLCAITYKDVNKISGNDTLQLLDEAGSFLSKAKKFSDPKNEGVKICAEALACAYSKYTTSEADKLEFSHQQALSLQNKYGLNKNFILFNFAIQSHATAEKSFEKKEYGRAEQNYRQSLDYLEKISPKKIAITNLTLGFKTSSEKREAEYYYFHSSCYLKLAFIQKSFPNLKTAKKSIEKAVELDFKDKNYYQHLKKCEYQIFNDILADNNKEQYVVRLLSRYGLYVRKNFISKNLEIDDLGNNTSSFKEFLIEIGIVSDTIQENPEKKSIMIKMTPENASFIKEFKNQKDNHKGF